MAPGTPRFDPISKPVISGPVPTLKSFASRVVSSHIAGLSDIGDVPYSLAQPFLAACSAVQLGDIELKSPHIRRESRELWKAHTLRDFFEVRIPYDKNEMKEPRNWRKVYIAAHEARQQKEADGRARLKDSYKALEDKRQERKVVYDPRIRGEPKKSASSGWSSSGSSRGPSNTIMSKVRGQTSHYAKTFKTPVSRPAPKRFPQPANGTVIATSSTRPAPSGIRAALANVPPRRVSSSAPSAAPQAPSPPSSTISSAAGSSSERSTTVKPSLLTIPVPRPTTSTSSILQALPPPLSYRAPSTASVLPGGSSFVDMKSHPIDPYERFVISSARSKAAERERVVPQGTFIPASARDEGRPKVAAVNFFGKGVAGGTKLPPPKAVVKVYTKSVVVPTGTNGGKSTPQSSPPAQHLAHLKRTDPARACPASLPLSTSGTKASPVVETLEGGSKPDAASLGGGPSVLSLPKRKESTMFIPAKRKKTVH